MVRDKKGGAKHVGDKGKKGAVSPFLKAVGPVLLVLRDAFVFTILTFLGAVVAVLSPIVLTDPGWGTARIIAGAIAAGAIMADKAADRYDKKLGEITFRESERSAEKAVDDLNIFISEAIESTFLRGAARIEAIKALRRTLARQAASAIGDDSRASYYSLRREAGGLRILDNPLHETRHGRNDRPNRPFLEREDPDHEVWAILDKADEETEVKSDPEVVYGVDWSRKKYKTFYSVPVKANMVQLGFLSVNNAKVGAIGGPQRASILGMARTMALVIAAQKGPEFLNTQAAYYQVSAGTDTVTNITEEVTP
ncbi:hypothetical protein [Cryobacterium sp. PH31-O1]|uniref:hypothetical protein n=1 Tax=Cryobacterium sp. PH31-O1 TaxID=3046306 RepID=UPI0024BA56F5|nr:hypothetical protein [Cryobacterium sp. PH31-O1]MDJ0337900.1 hypothetical protein [Cryobacterium sp. PH31-O1]